MQLAACVLLLIATAPAAEDELVLVLDLEPEGVEEREARLLTGRVANAVSELDGKRAVTSSDLADLVKLEEEKQLLGDCDTDSCLTEVAAALGARYVVNGRVGRIGSLLILQLGLFDAEGAGWLGRKEVETEDMGTLATRAPDAARALFGVEPPPAQPEPDPEPVPEPEPPEASLLPTGLLIAGAAVAVAGAGVATGMGLWALQLDAALRAPGTEVPPAEKAAIQEYAWMPLAGLAAGAAVGIGGLALAGLGLGLSGGTE